MSEPINSSNHHVLKWMLGIMTFLAGGAMLSGFLWMIKTTMENASDIRVMKSQQSVIEETLKKHEFKFQLVENKLRALEKIKP